MQLKIKTDVSTNSPTPHDGMLVSRTGLRLPYITAYYQKLLLHAIERCNQKFAADGTSLRWTRTDKFDCNLLIRLYLGDENMSWEDMWQDYLLWVDNNPANMPDWDLVLVCVPALMRNWYDSNDCNGTYAEYEEYVVDKIAEALYWDVFAPYSPTELRGTPWPQASAS